MNEAAFLLKKILTPLILPPTSLVLCALLGLLLLRRWPRLGRTLAWTALLLLLVLSLPFTANLLAESILVDSGLDSAAAQRAQAIIVLGGGRKVAPEYGDMTLSSASLERVRYGAKLARERGLPLLVTGGNVFGSGPSEGAVMAATLRDSFGTEVKWVEGRARDTHENAVMSAAMLKAEGIHTVLLVTHDIHQRRALREFGPTGLNAVPAPVSMVARGADRSFAESLPNAGSLGMSSQVLHEIIGTAILAPRTTAAR